MSLLISTYMDIAAQILEAVLPCAVPGRCESCERVKFVLVSRGSRYLKPSAPSAPQTRTLSVCLTLSLFKAE